MKFNPDLSIKEQKLDKRIIKMFTEQADFLYYDLKNNKNKIILVPAPRPMHYSHKIRQRAEYNPAWYSEIYWQYYPNFRRDRTFKSLNRIIYLEDGEFKGRMYKYDSIMREFIYEILTDGYYCEGYKIMEENLEFKLHFDY